LLLALISPFAHAALVSTTLAGVTIGAETYDVTFTQDETISTSFNDVFGAGSPALTFTNETDALAAATAVRDAVDAADFDVTPAFLLNGFVLPFAFDAGSFSHFTAWSDDPSFGDQLLGPFTNPRTQDFSISFASFQQVPNGVPEPATLALLALGFACSGLMRRRR
jgi:hypothetical protein